MAPITSALAGVLLANVANVAFAATLRGRASDVTYENVVGNSAFAQYILDMYGGNYAESYGAFSGVPMGAGVGFEFGRPTIATPYSVVTFENAAALILDPAAIPPQPGDDQLLDRRTCKDTRTCCPEGADGDTCRAWFDFFMICYNACVDDSKCTAVEVRMAAGECALFDGRLDYCTIQGEPGIGLDTPYNKDTFYWDKPISPVKAPTGYIAKEAQPDSDVAPIKTIQLTAEPCDSSFISVRKDNVDKCATECTKNTECTAFTSGVSDSSTGETTCTLYGEIKGYWYAGGMSYIKNETIKCANADEYFSYVGHMDIDEVVGCKPYLQEGEQCRSSYCFSVTDWTTDNHGCAPGLACLQDGQAYNGTCVKPGTFMEEADKQLAYSHAFVGKALPGADAGVNSTDMLFFDMAGRDWNYVRPAVETCEQYCMFADTARQCTVFEVNRRTEQCVVAYGPVCASSLVAAEDVVTIIRPDDRVVKQYFDLEELAGYKAIFGYYPVVPEGENANVKIHDIPCADYRDAAADISAIETECLKACDEWEGCHTVLFRSWESSCVLFAGEEGKSFTADPDDSAILDRLTFVNVGCAADEFYGFVVEQYFYPDTPHTYANESVVAEWDAVKAAHGYGAGSDNQPMVIEGSTDSECTYPVRSTARAACIPSLKVGEMCSLDTEPNQKFMDLSGSGRDGCGPDMWCANAEHDMEGDGSVITQPARCQQLSSV